MGNAKTKEEITINQASNGDARSQASNTSGLSWSECLLIALVVAAILVSIGWAYNYFKKGLKKTIRREIYKNELSKSKDDLEREDV